MQGPKKILLAVSIGTVVSAFAAAPFLISEQVEPRVRAETDRLNAFLKTSGIPAEVSVGDWQAGPLESSMVSTFTFTVQGQYGIPQRFCLEFDTSVQHDHLTLLQGDLVHTVSTLKPPLEQKACGFAALAEQDDRLSQFYSKHFGAEGPIRIDSRVGASGASHVLTQLKAAKDAYEVDGKAVSFDVKPAKIEVNVSSDGSGLLGSASWGGADFAMDQPGEKIKVSLAEYRLSFDQQRQLQNLWLGVVEHRLEAVSVDIKSGRKIQAVNVKNTLIGSHTELEKGRVASGMNVTLEDIELDGQPLGNLLARLSLQDMDAATLDRFLTAYEDLASEALTQDQIVALLDDFLAFASKCKVKLDTLELKNKDKGIALSGFLQLKDVDKDTLQYALASPALLIGYLDLKLQASLDQAALDGTNDPSQPREEERNAWIARMHTIIDPLLKSGMISFDEKQKQYTTALAFSGGELKLNGKLFPLPKRY